MDHFEHFLEQIGPFLDNYGPFWTVFGLLNNILNTLTAKYRICLKNPLKTKIYLKQIPKKNHFMIGIIIRLSLHIDNFAQLQDILVHVNARLLSSHLRQTATLWFSILIATFKRISRMICRLLTQEFRGTTSINLLDQSPVWHIWTLRIYMEKIALSLEYCTFFSHLHSCLTFLTSVDHNFIIYEKYHAIFFTSYRADLSKWTIWNLLFFVVV